MDKNKDPGIWAVNSDRFHQSDGELLDSGMLADAEVQCAKRTWKEGQTGKVTITGFKPAEIDCLLKFVYTGAINLRKSYPREDIWPALIKIWKMADFFCLDMLRDLVIEAAKDCSREMALVFCAFDPPDGHDQKKVHLFSNEFIPAVKAIYEDEADNIKCHFAPIVLGLAVASVHRFSRMDEFEKLLQDVPLFAADWAIAFMKGLTQPDWQLPRQGGWGHPDPDQCCHCNRSLNNSGVVDTFSFMRHFSRVLVCAECYGGPDLGLWKNPGGW